MTVRKEDLVAVRDPKGEIFEVSRRNASDLIQHKGWKLAKDPVNVEDALATEGRQKRARGEKVKAAQAAAKEAKDSKGKKVKTAPVLPTPEVEVDDNEPTFDEQQAAGHIDDELEALEDEESERGKP